MGGPSSTGTTSVYPMNNGEETHNPYPSTCAASAETTTSTVPPYLMGYAGSDPHYNTENEASTDTRVPMYLQERQGSTCCGCCCDFRRATIVVNSIIIGLSAFSLFSLFNRPDNTTEALKETMEITDDAVLEELAEVVNDSFWAGAILGGVLLVLTAVPLYGAYMFDVRMVGFGVVLLGATLVAEILLAYIYIQRADEVVEPTLMYEFNQPIFIYTVTALLQIIFMYPHVGLILEIRAGIMSFETYPREAYSCCCGSPRTSETQQQQQVQMVTLPSSTATATMNGQPSTTMPSAYTT